MDAHLTDSSQQQLDTLSTGTFQPPKSWFSRTSQPNFRRFTSNSKSRIKNKNKENKQQNEKGENDKGGFEEGKIEESRRQLRDLKERIYLFEYDMIQLRNQNKELKETIGELVRSQKVFERMLSGEKDRNDMKQIIQDVKVGNGKLSKRRHMGDGNPSNNNTNATNKLKGSKASPRLKKVKSQEFLKKRICSKMSRLEKLMSEKKSLCSKNI